MGVFPTETPLMKVTTEESNWRIRELVIVKKKRDASKGNQQSAQFVSTEFPR